MRNFYHNILLPDVYIGQLFETMLIKGQWSIGKLSDLRTGLLI